MTATPLRESEEIRRGELKDAKWELQRCGISPGERERCKGMGWGEGGELGSYGDAGKRICKAFGSTMPTLDMTDGREM